ncbi:MAG TPA: DNA polymerase IV [Acidimicrobiales bacterium]|nr:DNA polymerase IV [Acidimicrobiales bacterium]
MGEPSLVPTILHVDMDAFYASVEILDDPSLVGLPVIVGGAGARGVVASCTYEARRFGVRSAMPSARARQLCPQAVFLPGRHGRYAEVSAQLHQILADVTPQVEPIGLDEAFLNVAGALRRLGPPEVIAHGLRDRVRADLSLDCAVGIGRSKMIAKLASRAAKPRATRAGLEPGPGVVLIGPDIEMAFLHGHAVEALWGVGPATATRLHELGVRTVGDLAALPPETVVRRLGKASGLHLAALARGEDPDPVRPDRPTKSIGHEETFSQDLIDPVVLERHVLRMAESVATMLRGGTTAARTITVKVKFSDLSLQTRSHTLGRAITTGGAIGQVAAALLAGVDPGEGIRLLGVSASGLVESGGDQLSFDLGDGRDEGQQSATTREQSWSDVTAAVDAIRTRFGSSSVGSAAMVTDDGVQIPARRDAPWGPSE